MQSYNQTRTNQNEKYAAIPRRKLTPTKQRNNKTDSTITGIQTEGEENISIHNQVEQKFKKMK
jgi:hypothetical protein